MLLIYHTILHFVCECFSEVNKTLDGISHRMSVRRKIIPFCKLNKCQHPFLFLFLCSSPSSVDSDTNKAAFFEMDFRVGNIVLFPPQNVSYPVLFKLLLEYYCQLLLKICPSMSDSKLLWVEHI